MNNSAKKLGFVMMVQTEDYSRILVFDQHIGLIAWAYVVSIAHVSNPQKVPITRLVLCSDLILQLCGRMKTRLKQWKLY